ncbi:MAG: efflux RND transporter permease subunit [Bermanella sp.]
MAEGFANGIIRWRWLIIVMTLLMVMAAGKGGENITFSSNYRVFFAEGNEQLQAFDSLQNTYSKSDNVMFIMTPKKGDIFTKEFLGAVQNVTEQSWQLPWSTRVDSISNYQHTEGFEDDLVVEDMVDAEVELDAAAIERIKQVTLNEPVIIKRLLAKDGNLAVVNVTVQMPEVSEQEGAQLVVKVRALKDEMEALYPNIEFRISGMVMLSNAFSEMAQGDMANLMPIMFLILLITLGLLLRSITGTIATLIVIVLSIMTGMGIFGWLGWTLTPPSASAPTIIMTMAVADCVHILVTMLHNMRAGADKTQAIKESVRINIQPVFVTSLTTVLGFLSMNFSEVPPFRDLGNTVAIGITAAFLFSVFFLPALMSLLPVRVKVQEEHESRAMIGLSNFVINNRTWLLWGTVGLTAVLLFAASKNEINDEFVKYFSTNTDFRQDTDYLEANMTGIYTMEYSLNSGEENGISDPKFLADVEKLTLWLRTKEQVEHVNTISDVFKRLNKNMHADDEAFYKLPDSRELSAQYLLLYEMSLPYGLDLNNQVNINKDSTRLVVTVQNINSQESIALEHEINAWIDNNTSFASYYVASPNLMFSHIGERNVRTMVGGTLLALFLISLVLILALRSLKLGLISLAPNLFPAFMAFGLWAIYDGNLSIALATAVGMTLGIVVDDTVHFLSKYQRAKREQGKTAEEAVRYAFSSVGVALWVTTFVLVAGFSVLATSDFGMNHTMGLFTALTIAIALIVDFLFLPALLLKIEGGKEVDKEQSGEQAHV